MSIFKGTKATDPVDLRAASDAVRTEAKAETRKDLLNDLKHLRTYSSVVAEIQTDWNDRDLDAFDLHCQQLRTILGNLRVLWIDEGNGGGL